jgi:hypothetical protein
MFYFGEVAYEIYIQCASWVVIMEDPGQQRRWPEATRCVYFVCVCSMLTCESVLGTDMSWSWKDIWDVFDFHHCTDHIFMQHLQ